MLDILLIWLSGRLSQALAYAAESLLRARAPPRSPLEDFLRRHVDVLRRASRRLADLRRERDLVLLRSSLLEIARDLEIPSHASPRVWPDSPISVYTSVASGLPGVLRASAAMVELAEAGDREGFRSATLRACRDFASEALEGLTVIRADVALGMAAKIFSSVLEHVSLASAASTLEAAGLELQAAARELYRLAEAMGTEGFPIRAAAEVTSAVAALARVGESA